MTERRSSRMRRSKRMRSPGFGARVCAGGPLKLAEEAGWKGCRTWRRSQTQ